MTSVISDPIVADLEGRTAIQSAAIEGRTAEDLANERALAGVEQTSSNTLGGVFSNSLISLDQIQGDRMALLRQRQSLIESGRSGTASTIQALNQRQAGQFNFELASRQQGLQSSQVRLSNFLALRDEERRQTLFNQTFNPEANTQQGRSLQPSSPGFNVSGTSSANQIVNRLLTPQFSESGRQGFDPPSLEDADRALRAGQRSN